MIVAEVEQTRRRSGWTTRRTLKALGVSRATYYRQRQALEEDHSPVSDLVAVHRITPEEVRKGVTIQSDNGSAFVSADFARVLKENGVGHARIHPHTPEQNAFVEGVLRTLGEPWYEEEFACFQQAEAAMGEIVEWYNHHRLHSGIGYAPPLSCTSEKRTGSRRNVGSSSP